MRATAFHEQEVDLLRPPIAAIFMLLAAAGCTGIPPATSQPSGPSAAEIAAARVDRAGVARGNGLWALRDGTLAFSADGRAWSAWPGKIPLRHDATGLSLVVLDALRAWAVSGANSVSRTTDGGATWIEATLPQPCNEWVGLSFADPSLGYLVCINAGAGNDTVMATEDGGETWQLRTPRARSLAGWLGTDIAIAPDGGLWAAAVFQDTGTQAMLAVSRDKGVSWTDAVLPGSRGVVVGGGDIRPLGPPEFEGPNGAFAVADWSQPPGSTLRIWTTTDGGTTWESSRRLTQASAPIAFATSHRWVAVGASPSVFAVTNDRGGHWEQVEAEGLPDSQDTYLLAFATSDVGAIIMEVGTPNRQFWPILIATNDGGATWHLAEVAPS